MSLLCLHNCNNILNIHLKHANSNRTDVRTLKEILVKKKENVKMNCE